MYIWDIRRGERPLWRNNCLRENSIAVGFSQRIMNKVQFSALAELQYCIGLKPFFIDFILSYPSPKGDGNSGDGNSGNGNSGNGN